MRNIAKGPVSFMFPEGRPSLHHNAWTSQPPSYCSPGVFCRPMGTACNVLSITHHLIRNMQHPLQLCHIGWFSHHESSPQYTSEHGVNHSKSENKILNTLVDSSQRFSYCRSGVIRGVANTCAARRIVARPKRLIHRCTIMHTRRIFVPLPSHLLGARPHECHSGIRPLLFLIWFNCPSGGISIRSLFCSHGTPLFLQKLFGPYIHHYWIL